jgi:poly(3-hydroxybutyrate) depolymerase
MLADGRERLILARRHPIQTTMLAGVLPVLLLAASVSAQLTSKLTQITDFGPNPRNVSMYIYVPAKLQPNPPILVSPHWCHGTAENVFAYRSWASAGDKYGFITIYPDSPNKADQCWDVSSKESLTHNGGGDALGIVSMVRWTLEEYDGDRDRVFVSGTSSQREVHGLPSPLAVSPAMALTYGATHAQQERLSRTGQSGRTW